MTISAKVIAHSSQPGAPDLITLQCRYPRFIHAEAKTHRVMSIDDAEYEFLQEISFMDDANLSRNASSSRAIPIKRMIQDVIDDPAMPVAWGSKKPGMQAGEECTNKIDTGDYTGFSREGAWLFARDNAVDVAKGFAEAGYHKQIVNRLLEPFGHISVVVTATEWDNFFALRCHPDADPTMRALAEAMRDAIQASKPGPLEWHLPYINSADVENVRKHPTGYGVEGNSSWYPLAMISAARCARVSYLNHDGTDPDIEKDLALAKRLLDSRHMSPFEHQAQAWTYGVYKSHLSGNFNGWYQHRKIIEARE